MSGQRPQPDALSLLQDAAGFLAGVMPASGHHQNSGMDESMKDRLTFENLSVGQSWTSQSRTITEQDVLGFAEFSGDHNPLHVDAEFASNTPYRQRIAHGLLGLSWVAGLGSDCPAVDTIAFVGIRNWQFLKPLFFGDTVHVETRVVSMQDNPRRAGRVVWQLQLVNQRNEVTQSGEFETLVKVATRVPRPHFKSRADESRSARENPANEQ